ncbi:MAG: FecR family protein [Candidatus Nitrohelix vancouverensis]|uniref:FecR family protein n=1 Tax=Candidatus Nitrohelix vancouverensis TaxID=2705534 RepID=A0A7T0G4B7_9BACT|nr:MAG: FecR family protein [Candidatus Nitrohelix vancouverensis]
MNQEEKGAVEIDAQASLWVMRQGSPDFGPAERARLEAWRMQSAQHEAAYQLACQTWDELGKLTREDLPSSAKIQKRQFKTFPPAAKPRARFITTIAASILLLFVVTSFFRINPLVIITADYYTSAGQISTVALADGSSVQLNTGTAIAVQFDDRQRRIKLIEGEAAFKVAPSNGVLPPFVVEAANWEAKALGTEFIVRRDGDAVNVTVLEHRVEVSASERAAPEQSPILLHPGNAIHLSKAKALGPVTTVDLESEASWQRGQLVFDRVPLSEVVDSLNRYRRSRILISDAALSGRQVSGVFHIDRLGGAADTIAAEVGAQSVQIFPFVTLLY